MNRSIRIPITLIGLVVLLAACEKARPIQIPADAHTHLTASRVAALRAFPGVGELKGLPSDEPGWYFCDDFGCAAGTADTEIVLASTADERALERWRGWSGATLPRKHVGDAELIGHVDVSRYLAESETKTKRGAELLERAVSQLGSVKLAVQRAGPDELRGDFRLEVRPGEPRFVSDLGTPKAELPALGGLVDGDTLAVLRVSVGPDELWTLVRSALSADDRGRIDSLFDALRKELHVDAQKALLDNLTGHFVVAAYSVGSGKSAFEWLTGQATEEAVVIGITDDATMRRFLNAMTQVTRGRLVSQSKSDGAQWAWISEDGELRWTLVLRADHLVVVDGVVAYEHVQAMGDGVGAPTDRAIDALLAEGRRSGFHARQKLLRAVAAGEFWERWGWITVVVEGTDSEEVLRLRAGHD